MRLIVTLFLASLAGVVPGQGPVGLDWQMDQTLAPRDNQSMCWHGGTHELVVFGGKNLDVHADTWTFGTSWRRLDTGVAPSPRMNPLMAYDSQRGRIVLFGGRTTNATLGDTWAFDGTTWTPLAPAASPGPRYGGSMVYDSVRDRVVLRGGFPVSGAPFTDLWEFDGSTWSLRPQSGTQPSPYGGASVFDPVRAVTLLLADALHTWDGTTWQTIGTIGLPQPIPSGPLVYDSSSQRVLLINPHSGTSPYNRLQAAYAWQGSTWTQVGSPLCPTQRYLTMHWDDARNRVVGFEHTDTFTSHLLNHTWVFEQDTWQAVATGSPRGRRNGAIAYDRARGRHVLHGGNTTTSAIVDVFELADRTWSMGMAGNPGATHYRAMAFDEARAVTWVFGDTGQSLLGWTGTGSFSIHAVTPAPAARSAPTMAYDSLRARTLVFGGEGLSGHSAELWSWNGVSWTNLTPAVGPQPRRGARLSYDRARDRMVLFGGSNGATTFADTWEFDGTQWLAATPANAPAARSLHVQVYDEHRQYTVLFGGSGAASYRDSWTWDGANWSPLATATLPDVGAGACGDYDPHRREVVVFGSEVSNSGIWRLRDASLGEWTTLGSGCDAGGNGPLVLNAVTPLAIGTTSRLLVDHLPPTFVAMPIAWLGFQAESWNGLPLPLSLATLGAPSCQLWADTAVGMPILALGNGTATIDLWLAHQPAFVGHEIFVQAGVLDFSVDRVGTANALRARVGVP